ncbi:TonB-dependent receptor [Bowmanella dokdonensis]|uniref:TonB-dependent receptor n=1 Tax=Bowmanella dokdonensis TaxID=751969 RepID=A0A939DR79_9ALTE|nr:TonB-dependent receptor [Bowmanella dokdonensis]MBN7827183.1 TonB-dependent receptor [Bowmanella dokdonensis]
MRKHNRIFMAVQVALLAGQALPALAQDEKQDEVEVVEVKGFRGSVQKSLNIKRLSSTIVDAISAEDIGKFPDQTVADAMSRITGVQVEKTDGESDKVSIRGTAPHLNLTLLNGQNVASATASTSILTPSRGFNYSLLPAEVVETLEVHKSAQAKVDEGSIGGTVIVKTRKPLSTDRNYLVLSARDAYQESSGEHSPLLSGFYSWKNQASDFGVNLGAVHKGNGIRRDRVTTAGFVPAELGGDTLYAPSQARASRYESDKDLNTLTATFEYAAGDNFKLIFNNLYSSVDVSNEQVANGAYVVGSVNEIINPQLNGDTIVSGQVPANEADANWAREVLYSAGSHDGSYDTRVHDLQLEYRGDNFTWTTQLGHTEAEGEIQDDQVEFQASALVGFEVGDGQIHYDLPDDLTPGGYTGLYTHRNLISNTQQETYLQTDLNWLLDSDWLSSVDLGLKYRDHNKTSALFKVVWHPDDVGAMTLADFTDGALVDDFMGEGHSQSDLYQFRYASWDEWTATTEPLREYDHLQYGFDLTEKVTNAYVQGNFAFDKLSGNIGVRYARTEQRSEGVDFYMKYTWAPETWTWVPVIVERDYTDVLPSLNLNYQLKEDVILRFAAAKVMSRPDYDLLTSRRGYRLSAWSNPKNPGFQGNPNLDPYRATQYDISAEYYFTDSSILSLAFFYKDISTYIDEQYFPVMLPDDEGNVDEYNLKTPVNSNGGVNQGVEVNLQHDFDNGFGLLANYTYADAEMDEEGKELPNNSENTYNATVYYEKDALSVRLSYNYRGSYYAGVVGDMRWYQQGYGQLDANLSYHLNENVTLLLQGVNLSDAKQEANVGDDSRPYFINHYGRRLFAGVQMTF